MPRGSKQARVRWCKASETTRRERFIYKEERNGTRERAAPQRDVVGDGSVREDVNEEEGKINECNRQHKETKTGNNVPG